MLDIQDPVYFAEVVTFASTLPKKSFDSLMECLERMSWYADNGNRDTVCRLCKDFAPHSFRFLVVRPTVPGSYKHTIDLDGKTYDIVLNGGAIYEGPDSPNDGSFPALTVSVDEYPGHPVWRVHT